MHKAWYEFLKTQILQLSNQILQLRLHSVTPFFEIMQPAGLMLKLCAVTFFKSRKYNACYDTQYMK